MAVLLALPVALPMAMLLVLETDRLLVMAMVPKRDHPMGIPKVFPLDRRMVLQMVLEKDHPMA
jgi:hypothetical protein